jgi:hypothetical protein
MLFREVKRLGGTSVVLSTNVELRQDGIPYASRRAPDDPGVAVYFTRGKRQLVFCCDRWDKVEDNLWAVTKTIDAIRGIERWGSGDMVEAAFSGFQALAAPPTAPWWAILGVQPHYPTETIAATFTALARVHHPDRGGDGTRMAEINAAYEAFKRERGIA